MASRSPWTTAAAFALLVAAAVVGVGRHAVAVPDAGTLHLAPANALPVNTLLNFPPAQSGAGEFSALTEAGGNFYGVSALGGFEDNGYIYRVSRRTGQITHLHDFQFSDGATPRGTLILGSDGYLYGTTEAGGANRSDYCYGGQYFGKGACGVAYKISPMGAFTKLHDFYTAADGYQAAAGTGMLQASDGNFYGMALIEFPTETGSVFKMTPDGTVTVFYALAADFSQGFQSQTGLIQARDANLYGTTTGECCGTAESGTIFRLSLAGDFQTVYLFQGAPQNGSGDGANPWGNLIQGKDDALYGTSFGGGITSGHCIVSGCGTVFRVTTSGEESILYRFNGNALDGENPQNAGLVQTPDGTLYGVTGGNPYGVSGLQYCYSGISSSPGCGTLFALTTGGRFKQVHNFGSGDSAYGLFPMTSMIQASDKNLYGVALDGGGFGSGVVYRLQLNPTTPVIEISSVSPAGGSPGTAVTIHGTGFTGATEVTFPTGNVTPISFTVESDTEIGITVPENGVSGAIGVTAPRGTTFSPQLFYLQPTVSSLVPTRAPVGGSVTVLGTHFDDLTSITVGYAPVTKFTDVTSTDTAMDFTIPTGAVTNPSGSANSQTLTGTAADPQRLDEAARVQSSPGPHPTLLSPPGLGGFAPAGATDYALQSYRR